MSYNLDKVKQDSIGKWPGILEKLGIQVGTGKHGPCPIPGCGGKDRYRFDDKGNGMWFCNQCGAGDGFKLVMKVLNIDFKEAIETVGKIVGTVESTKYQKETTVSPQTLRKMFNDSKPIKEGDPAYMYLKNRGLEIDFLRNVRCTSKAWEPERKQDTHAMLSIFHKADGKAVTMLRTYITHDGYKQNIDKVKKIMPALDKMKGGAVRLYDLNNPEFLLHNTLGITEGIETAIACKMTFQIPVWASLSSTLMEGFIPPKDIETLIIFADNDKNFAGQKAAYCLANRIALEKKINVSVDVPEVPGEDFLDEMNRLNGKG